MPELNIQNVTDFVDHMTNDADCFDLLEWAENYGDGTLVEAIENEEIDPDQIVCYVMKAANDFPEVVGRRMSEILKVHSDIEEALVLIGKATMILVDYNRRFDNSADSAIDDFFANTTHNPKRMFIELIESTIV